MSKRVSTTVELLPWLTITGRGLVAAVSLPLPIAIGITPATLAGLVMIALAVRGVEPLLDFETDAESAGLKAAIASSTTRLRLPPVGSVKETVTATRLNSLPVRS